jgi:membrane protease YdiL (CAAX protease family)
MPLLRPLCITAGVTALVALLSYALPAEWQSTGVGFCLLVATYVLVLRHDASTIRHHGLGLGGIFEPVPLDPRRILVAIGMSLLHALLAAIVFFPLFWLGFVIWWRPARDFTWPAPPAAEALLTQVLGIAMPEEMFYRGYAQTAIDDASKWRVRLLGAEVGAGLVLGSIVFALGHVATTGQPARLSVFFPSLVFGWLRAPRASWSIRAPRAGWGARAPEMKGARAPEMKGGIGAAVAFHAACNIFSALLTDAYFPS